MNIKHNLEFLDRIFPVFQPIVPMPWTLQDVVIYEMLARMVSEDGFILQPDEFINKKINVINVDLAMLKRASDMHDKVKNLHLSVNCSPSSLCCNDYFDVLRSMVVWKEIDPKRLMLEITEDPYDSFLDIEIMDRVETLRSHGLRIALDDFGAGSNGILRLAMAHVDMIKISPGLEITSQRGRILIEGMLSIINKLSELDEGRVTMVIEGLETEKQIGFANYIGANYAQGRVISEPTENIIDKEELIKRVIIASATSMRFV